MRGMDVTLPGGLAINGRVERRSRFRQITGKTELALIELEQNDDLSFVSSVLELMLESIGDSDVDAATVGSLCMADRQFLMLRLAAILEGEQVWLKASCGKCSAPFDVEFKRCDLPIKPAGEGYPETEVRLSSGPALARTPTAADQISIRYLSETEAVRHLLRLCLKNPQGEPPRTDWVDSLDAEDIERVDAALDQLSPAVCNELLVTCPECGEEQLAPLNHYRLSGLNQGAFFNEIHTLALYYHWSEQEILAMPRERRRRYLGLIDRSRAMVGGEA